jgi:hypothetical protein
MGARFYSSFESCKGAIVLTVVSKNYQDTLLCVLYRLASFPAKKLLLLSSVLSLPVFSYLLVPAYRSTTLLLGLHELLPLKAGNVKKLEAAV